MELKAVILAAEDLPRRAVEVPEWGCTVWVRGQRADERDAFESENFVGPEGEFNRRNLRARLLVRTLVDEQGQRLFSDAEAVELGGKSGAVLDRLYAVALELSGMRKKDVDELEKNSASTPAAS